MKKLYSLVLMATALLIGTNVWAANVTDFAGLQSAISAAVSGTPTSIVLDDDISATSTISVTDGKKIEIDLNGHNITSTTTSNMLNINNGSLSLVNSQSTGGTISGTGCSAIASMTGSNEDVANYSVLTVGEGVTLTVDGDYGINMFQGPKIYDETKKKYVTSKYGYGMVLNVAGTVYSPNGNGVWVLGNIKNTEGTNHSQINVLPTGSIIGSDVVTPLVGKTKAQGGSAVEQQVAKQVGEGAPYGTSSCGLYGGGFCNYHIQGAVSGGNGIYMKGGNLNIDGGNISATASEYWKPLFYGNGCIAAGSAIVLDNNASYCSVMTMTVTGNAVVTSETGNAIEELVTSGTEKMGAEDFVIESGTFVSGTDQNNVAHDAVTVTTQLGTEVKNEGTVSGGMFSTPVDNVLAVTGETTTITVDGVDYQVIHTAADPTKTLANSTIADPVQMDGGAPYTVGAGKTAKAKYLELKNGAAVVVEGTLVIGAEGAVVNGASSITVKSTGVLVINGGIITTSVDQLIVEASETQSGVLVAAPGVSWNAQPLATVQFYTFAKQFSATNNAWQRIATPLSVYSSIANDFAGPTQDGNAFTTWVQKWNGTGWEYMSSWADLKAFSGYALSNNSISGGVTYSFKGNIQGGVSSELNFISNGLNFFGNSYIAPISIAAMLPKMVAAGADDAIHIWNAESQRYESGSTFYAQWGLCPDKIPATQTFVLNLGTGTSASADLDYANSVWAPYANLISTSAPAPAKRAYKATPANMTFVQINIAGADGDMDKVMLVEGAQFSDEFDNGADIEKFMEENRLNVYVEGTKKYAAAASDDILGTTLAIQAQNNVNYTMTFSNVMGEGYAIKDMMTGVVTEMVEGNEYHFVAQPNATTEARFQIVEPAKLPTAIENTEVKANVKGIYSMTGMYLGEDFEALPAGVYVVDGVKIVK